MADQPFESAGEERAWDEYDWERFLQQQDRKTEKYMELLEKYLDDPNRDQIIAREMGWHHLLDENGKDWSEDLEEDAKASAQHGQHPLYQAAGALNVFIDHLFDESDPAAQHPAVARLTTSCTLANVKLAAALSDDDVDEIGMTIAYLKRALKAITNALDAAALCRQEQILDHEQAQDLRTRIFHVRDGIVSLMGHYRNEGRRRHGNGC